MDLEVYIEAQERRLAQQQKEHAMASGPTKDEMDRHSRALASLHAFMGRLATLRGKLRDIDALVSSIEGELPQAVMDQMRTRKPAEPGAQYGTFPGRH